MTNKSPQIKARVNEVVKDLERGKNRAELLPKYAKKWGIAETTIDRYLKDARAVLKDRQKLAQKVSDETLTSETKNAVIQGVKSKTERILFYQNEIDIMEQQLRGEVEFTFTTGNKIMQSHSGGKFILPLQAQNDLRGQIKNYQAEISKIEGDYAPSKVAQTNKDGKDVPSVDISKLSINALKELRDLYD